MTVRLHKPGQQAEVVSANRKPVKVMLAVPAYSGTIHMLTFRSIMAEVVEMAKRGWQTHLIDEIGNGLIGDCRAKMVARFLTESDFTHLVFIDSDVCWKPGSLVRLIEHKEDFIAGLYPRRSDPITFSFRSKLENGEGLEFNEKGLVQVWGVPFGFVVLTRACCQKMVEAYDELKFQAERGRDTQGNNVPALMAWALFDPYRPEGTMSKLGEDYSFCARWRDIGGKVFVDPYIPMGHIGLKTFEGTLGECMEAVEAGDKTGEAA